MYLNCLNGEEQHEENNEKTIGSSTKYYHFVQNKQKV